MSLKWKPRGRLAVRPTGRGMGLRTKESWSARSSATLYSRIGQSARRAQCALNHMPGVRVIPAAPAAIRLHYGMMP